MSLPFFIALSLPLLIDGHRLIGDVEGALTLCEQAKKELPDDPEILRKELLILANSGRFEEAHFLWKRLEQSHPFNLERDFALIEELAFGALMAEGRLPDRLHIHRLRAVAASRDPRGVPLILKELKSSSTFRRYAAAKAAHAFPDQEVKKALIQQLALEPHPEVIRELVITMLGFEMSEAAPLFSVLAESTSLGEEERALLLAAKMHFEPDRKAAILKAASASLPQLRAAAAIEAFNEEKELLSELVFLAEDPNLRVRLLYLELLAQRGKIPPALNESIRLWPKHGSEPLAMASLWLLCAEDKEFVRAHIADLYRSKSSEARLSLSALLPFVNGAPLSDEPLEKINYYWYRSMLSPLKEDEQSALLEAVGATSGLIMRQKLPGVAPVALFTPSRIMHNQMTASMPELVDAITRLEIYNRLFMQGDLRARDRLEAFFQQKGSVLLNVAAYNLWQKGEHVGVDILRSLLEKGGEYDVEVSLLLAYLEHDVTAAKALARLYPSAKPDQRIAIIEALSGFEGDFAIQFLLARLDEPTLMVRQVAAASLLCALYL